MHKSISCPSLSSLAEELTAHRGDRTRIPQFRSRSPSPANNPVLGATIARGRISGADVTSDGRPGQTSLRALPLAFLPPDLSAPSSHQPMEMMAQEIEMESSMHVTPWAFMNCEASFGFPSLPAAPSIKIPPSFAGDIHPQPGLSPSMQLEPTASGSSSGLIEHTKALAACLATPVEPPVTNEVASNLLRNLRGTAEEVNAVVNRWGEWVRRIRRRRRAEQAEAVLAALTSGAAYLTPEVEEEGEGNSEGERSEEGEQEGMQAPRLAASSSTAS